MLQPQRDISQAARAPREAVIAIEAGQLGRVTVDQLRAIADASGGWIELRVRSVGGDASEE